MIQVAATGCMEGRRGWQWKRWQLSTTRGERWGWEASAMLLLCSSGEDWVCVWLLMTLGISLGLLRACRGKSTGEVEGSVVSHRGDQELDYRVALPKLHDPMLFPTMTTRKTESGEWKWGKSRKKCPRQSQPAEGWLRQASWPAKCYKHDDRDTRQRRKLFIVL